MRSMILVSMVLALLAAASGARAQEGREGAAGFMEWVFASYGDDQPGPIDDRHLDEVWSPRMAGLIRRDRELADGDLPWLDADPVCDCQDFEDIRVLDTQVNWRDGRVVVTVRFVNGGVENTGVFLLSGNPIRGWRIDDVLNDHGPGLAENLEASNRSLESGGRALGRD